MRQAKDNLGDVLLNLLFGCRHRKTSRPMTPVRKPGAEPGVTYVVCLDCGQQFHYDTSQMRIRGRLRRALPSA